MQVLKLSDVRRSNDPLRTQITRLITVVDSPKFKDELFEIAHCALRCEHITAFVANDMTRPRLVLASEIARALSDRYIEHYWNLDPATRTMPLCPKDGGVALRIAPDIDINDDVYRRDCYTRLQISERITLMQRRGPDVYRLNFYAGSTGGFPSEALECLMESGDLLMSLVIKNDAANIADTMLPENFANRLRMVAPDIPQREAEVCTAIMLGMTSEAIALKLGISVNTVLTYRKRAYHRLNISCQNELMRLILS